MYVGATVATVALSRQQHELAPLHIAVPLGPHAPSMFHRCYKVGSGGVHHPHHIREREERTRERSVISESRER